MKYFDQLADRIEKRWRACHHSEDDLPALAADALREMPAHAYVDPLEILCAAARAPSAVEPRASSVDGVFQVTVRCAPRFVIEVRCAFEGSAAIHEHAHTGAFQVLCGSCLTTHYSFRTTRKINSRFRMGEAEARGSEMLRRGDVRMVRPGDEGAHALFHLDDPTVTISVRTVRESDARPPFVYHAPFVATPARVPPERAARDEALIALQRIDERLYLRELHELLRAADLEDAFWLLHEHPRRARDREDERFARLLETAKQRHPEHAPAFGPVFERATRQRRLCEQRRRVTDPELRFYLGVLVHADDEAHARSLVRHAFPERDPDHAIEAWAARLQAEPRHLRGRAEAAKSA